MKKIRLFFINILILFLVFACNSGYTKQGSKWVWVSYDEAVGKRVNEIDEHDINTFEILEDEKYAKDKDRVYFIGKIIKGAKPKSFQILGYGYSKDAENVFLDTEKVIFADPNSFIQLDFPYSKDNYHIFCGTIPLSVDSKEINEFIVTNENKLMSGLKSTMLLSNFIQTNPDYKWIDTLNIDKVIVGEWGTGRTKERKFKGVREIK